MTPPRNGEETRRRILLAIDQAQAIHKSELQRRVERAWGTVGYHLRKLKAAGLVKLEDHGGQMWAFPSHLSRKERRHARLLAEESAHAVIDAVDRRPGATVQEVFEDVELSMKTVRRHLSRLSEAGVLERKGRRPQRFVLLRRL